MGEKYIKKEGDKEVVYEKGILGDTKIGELHEKWNGSKETRSIIGTNVKVESEHFLSTERKAEIGDQKGVFKKGILDSYPSFKPEKTIKDTSEESNSTSRTIHSEGASDYSSSSMSSTVSGSSKDSEFLEFVKGFLIFVLWTGGSWFLKEFCNQLLADVNQYSLVWWLIGVVWLLCWPGIIVGALALLAIGLVVLIVYGIFEGIFWLITYFIKNPY